MNLSPETSKHICCLGFAVIYIFFQIKNVNKLLFFYRHLISFFNHKKYYFISPLFETQGLVENIGIQVLHNKRITVERAFSNHFL